MSLWNKILLTLIFLLSLGLFFFTARALKTHAHWRSKVVAMEKKISDGEAERVRLERGTPEQPGLWQLERELHQVVLSRGRVWRGVQPGTVQPQPNGDVLLQVTVERPQPHGIAVRTILYVFDQTPLKEGGQYIGQFIVTGVAETQVQLSPAMRFSPRELQRVQQSRGPWELYDVMPTDEPGLFANQSAEQVRAQFPEEVAAYFLDPKRQLHDYSVLYRMYHRERSRLIDQTQVAQHDLQSLTAAVTDAQRQQQFRQTEIQDLQGKLAQLQKDRDAVQTHLAAVEAKKAELEKAVSELTAQNQATAADIARMQREIVQVIENRTQGVAQATP